MEGGWRRRKGGVEKRCTERGIQYKTPLVEALRDKQYLSAD